MNWKSIKTDFRWRLRYELFRRVLPRLEYEPFAIKHLSNKAWPIISALTSAHDYADGIASFNWQNFDENDDGSELLLKYASESRPLVLKGYAKGCPQSSWTMDDLKSELGDEIVTVRVGDYLSDFGQPRSSETRLGEFVDYLQGIGGFPFEDMLVDGVGPYVGNQQIPRLAAQLPRPELFASRDHSDDSAKDLTTFWLGSADAITPLHCHHFCDTFVIQLIGRRSFTLIPPHQALLVGYMPQNINIGMAAYDPYNPDPERFPGSDQIQAFDIDLGPGDALLLPGFWFHAVNLTAPSLLASRFVRSRMPAALGGGSPRKWREAGPYLRGW